jgi:hypothetical protein
LTPADRAVLSLPGASHENVAHILEKWLGASRWPFKFGLVPLQ